MEARSANERWTRLRAGTPFRLNFKSTDYLFIASGQRRPLAAAGPARISQSHFRITLGLEIQCNPVVERIGVLGWFIFGSSREFSGICGSFRAFTGFFCVLTECVDYLVKSELEINIVLQRTADLADPIQAPFWTSHLRHSRSLKS